MWLKWRYNYQDNWNYYLMQRYELDFLNTLSFEQVSDIVSEDDIDVYNLPIPLQEGIRTVEYSIVDKIPLRFLQKEIERLDKSIYYDTCQRDIYLQVIQERQYDKS